MRVFLVTGAAGFLGSHLCEALLTRGFEVWGVDDLSGGEIANLALGLRFRRIDCADTAVMAAVMREVRPDVVYHCAALAHEGLSVFSPATIGRSVYQASVSVFSAAAAAKVKRVVFTSSMARYGRQSSPFLETMPPAPVDPYGIAKVAAEDTLRALAGVHGFEWAIAVPHNIIGTRQKFDDPFRNVASIMLNRLKSGMPAIIYGDGQQRRCFSPVADCLDSLLRMATDATGEVVNIGPDTGAITISELAQKCADAAGVPLKTIHFPARPLEVREATCSSDKARRLLGYKERMSLDECLGEMARAMVPRPFNYHLPIEISNPLTPETWRDRLV